MAASLAAVALLTVAVSSPAAADERRDQQWYLPFLKAGQAHKITKGEGVTVAVIDTGVDAKHPDLAGNVVEGIDMTTKDGSGDGRTDTDGHGTAMASLIAGHGHGPGKRDGILGLAPETRILPVRSRTGAGHEIGSAYHAFRWAADNGADVINFSGSTNGIEDAVEYALDRDVVVVAAAGNTEQHDGGVIEPASYPGVIAVSGVAKDGEFTKASVQGAEVVLASPAVDVVAAWAGNGARYSTATGTSNATAFVSAAAALVRAKHPDLNAASVIERLIRTADDKGPQGRDTEYGFGVVNPLSALTADVPEVEENPLGSPNGGPPAEASPSPTRLVVDDQNPGSTGLLIGLVLAAVITIAVLAALMVVVRRRRRSVGPPAPPAAWLPQSHHPPPGPQPPGTAPGPPRGP